MTRIQVDAAPVSSYKNTGPFLTPLLHCVITESPLGSRCPARIASSMHIVTAIVLAILALVFLVLGLIGVLQDLLERGPYDAPLVGEPLRKEDPAAWPGHGEPRRNEICR